MFLASPSRDLRNCEMAWDQQSLSKLDMMVIENCKWDPTFLWLCFLPLIQVDIGGHPPFPNGSKHTFQVDIGGWQFWQFNLLFLAGFNFGAILRAQMKVFQDRGSQ
jgi:hypothetical protein